MLSFRWSVGPETPKIRHCFHLHSHRGKNLCKNKLHDNNSERKAFEEKRERNLNPEEKLYRIIDL